MKIKDIISSKAKAFPSLEIVPPLKGVSKSELLDSIRPFMEFNPPYINVTRHRDEFEFVKEVDGSFTRHTVRRRISETAVCAAIQNVRHGFKGSLPVNILCQLTDAFFPVGIHYRIAI